MRLIVLSDSHGDDFTLRWMLEQAWKTLGPVDAYVHCGDGAHDLEYLQNFIRSRDEHAAFYSVRGNCDFCTDLPDQQVLHLGGARIFLTHGHRYHVKSTLSYLSDAASEHECTLALFGHTHIATAEMRSALLINPGSAAKGRMAVVEITNGKPRWDLLAF